MILDKDWQEERKAKKVGVRDGRAGIPTADWQGGPVPFLGELQARYSILLQGLHRAATNMVGRSVHIDHKFIALTQELTTDLIRLEGEAQSLVDQAESAIEERDGLKIEAPEGKIARRRGIPTYIYIICLFSLIIGEFLVTVKAAAKVMNLEIGDWRTWLVTGSIALLSVILAHLFGISLKERLDRATPQPPAILWGFGILGILFTITLLFLSAMRASEVQSNVTLGLSNAAFGTILFFVLQLTFIGAGTGLSFYNHSELDARIKTLLRKLKRVNRQITRVRKKMASSPASRMNRQKVEVQRKALLQEYESIHARYSLVASVYVRFNVLNQRNKVDTLANGLTPAPLPEFDKSLAIEMPETEFENADTIEDRFPPRVFWPKYKKDEPVA